MILLFWPTQGQTGQMESTNLQEVSCCFHCLKEVTRLVYWRLSLCTDIESNTNGSRGLSHKLKRNMKVVLKSLQPAGRICHAGQTSESEMVGLYLRSVLVPTMLFAEESVDGTKLCNGRQCRRVLSKQPSRSAPRNAR